MSKKGIVPKHTAYRLRNLDACRAQSRDAYYKRRARAAMDPEYDAHQKEQQRQGRLRVDKIKRKLSCIRFQCRKRGIPFNLEPADIVIPEVCPVLGEPIKFATGKASRWSVSIDRSNPSLGYVKGNVEIMSKMANTMKQDATPEQLLRFAQWAIKTYAADECNVTVSAGKVESGGNTAKDVLDLLREVKKTPEK